MTLESKIKENVIKGLSFVFIPGSIMKSLSDNRNKLCLSDNDPHYMFGVVAEFARLAFYTAAIYHVIKNSAERLI